MPRALLHTAAALALFAAALPASAATRVGLAGFAETSGIDFALNVQSTTLGVQYADQSRADFDLNMLGVSWYETLAERLDGGIELGYAELTQSGDPLLAGRSPDGYFAGVLLRLHAYDSAALRLTLDAGYRYLDLEDNSADPGLRLKWQTARAGLRAATPVSQGLWAFGRAYYAATDGERLVRGQVDNTSDFKQQHGLGYALGLAVDLGREGDVSVQWEEGHASGVTLSFSRRF